MKKILIALLLILLLLPCALSEGIDLTGFVYWYEGGMIHRTEECPFMAAEETDNGIVFGTFDQALEAGCTLLCSYCTAGDIGGVVVLPGIWTVGQDIPAGAYSVSLVPGGPTYVPLHVWSKAAGDYDAGSFSFTLREEIPVIGKVVLEDGNTVELSAQAVFAPAAAPAF